MQIVKDPAGQNIFMNGLTSINFEIATKNNILPYLPLKCEKPERRAHMEMNSLYTLYTKIGIKHVYSAFKTAHAFSFIIIAQQS